MFQVSYDKDWHILELLPFFLIGILGGLYGAVFIKLTSKLSHFRAKVHPLLLVLIISLSTSLLSYPLDLTRMSNTVFVAQLFSECKENDPDPSLLCRSDFISTLTKFY